MDPFQRHLVLAISDANEALRDLSAAVLAPEAAVSRIVKAAGSAAGLARAEERIKVACGQEPSLFPMKIETAGKAELIYDPAKLPVGVPFTVIETRVRA